MPAASPHPFAMLVEHLLRETLPLTVLVNGPNARHLITTSPAHIHEVDTDTLLAGNWQQRVDLAITVLEPGPSARALLATLRDIYAKRLLVFLNPQAQGWTNDTLVGLGFSLLANYDLDGEHWQAWSFDILTYKPAPDWLNPRFWANPENWDRFRW